ncbi:hypothetical protein ASPZODRAFT_1891806 [Penicilliopsis zonata CBS 506.65]|uniref:Uncharacterized protein n=1 Tax=Penicilliopsis zonata CBS 506.65 TaxID=1073090 RepID=A0A1L9SIW0_9EURO|nr:hypothetical protein ASPZODRAFT_1891806 [Penicilliopsis zonata CBS 506.65]OJJ47077.1 hypothetical protein ASPZODRAFT_1891806 [Penicilliopsis zonata CBS 506.65]
MGWHTLAMQFLVQGIVCMWLRFRRRLSRALLSLSLPYRVGEKIPTTNYYLMGDACLARPWPALPCIFHGCDSPAPAPRVLCLTTSDRSSYPNKIIRLSKAVFASLESS